MSEERGPTATELRRRALASQNGHCGHADDRPDRQAGPTFADGREPPTDDEDDG